jgi:hypothetical protein
MKPIEFEGEGRAVVFAKDQPEYEPLPARVGDDQVVHSRWELTDEERSMIAVGGCIDVKVWTYSGPLQPMHLSVAGVVLAPATEGAASSAPTLEGVADVDEFPAAVS